MTLVPDLLIKKSRVSLLQEKETKDYSAERHHTASFLTVYNNTTAVLCYVTENNNEGVRFSILKSNLTMVCLRLYIHACMQMRIYGANEYPTFLRTMLIVSQKKY